MGSNPIGTQIFSRSHARVTLFHISCNLDLLALQNVRQYYFHDVAKYEKISQKESINIKGPLKYLLMPLLGKNQLAITLHMYASIGPNLDNTHRGQI